MRPTSCRIELSIDSWDTTTRRVYWNRSSGPSDLELESEPSGKITVRSLGAITLVRKYFRTASSGVPPWAHIALSLQPSVLHRPARKAAPFQGRPRPSWPCSVAYEMQTPAFLYVSTCRPWPAWLHPLQPKGMKRQDGRTEPYGSPLARTTPAYARRARRESSLLATNPRPRNSLCAVGSGGSAEPFAISVESTIQQGQGIPSPSEVA